MPLKDKTVQCEENIRALMFHYHIPLPPDVIKPEQDRCTFRLMSAFLAVLYSRVQEGKFRRRGWRFWKEEYREQLQVEIDIDYRMPYWDLVRSFQHLKEVLGNWRHKRKTDPFIVLAGLRKRGIQVEHVREA